MRTLLEGIGLFAFIPLVLFLFVRHPQPYALSLFGGIFLMLGHRFLTRPYMEQARPRKCLWCNRSVFGKPSEAVMLEAGSRAVEARACPDHVLPLRSFFRHVDRWKPVLRAGIFLPLLFLLGSLAAATLGKPAALPWATDLFRLIVGLTVNLAAIGAWVGRETDAGQALPATTPLAVPFPVHNFFLLGVRSLLWVFRLVGIWWVLDVGFGIAAKLLS